MLRHMRTLLIVVAALSLGACDEPGPISAPPQAAPAKVPLTTDSEAARDAFLRGREKYDALHFAEAHRLFSEAADQDPTFAMAQLMRAATTDSAQTYYEAINAASEALQHASAGEQLYIRAFMAGAQGDGDEQYRLLKKLQALYGRDERVHMQLGRYHLENGQFEDAILHFRHAIDIAPTFAAAHNMLGYAYRYDGDFAAAKDVFSRYVELVPNEPNPLDSYAELLLEAGDYEASLDKYRQALAIAPGFAASRVGVIINYSMLGRHADAIAAANDMFDRADSTVERRMALVRLSGACLHAGDHAAALAALDRLAQLGEEMAAPGIRAQASDLAGDILLMDGDADAALGSYRKALELRREAMTSDAERIRAKREFLFKSTLAAIQSGRRMVAARYLEQFRRDVAGAGSKEQWRLHELEGYASIMNGDYGLAVKRLRDGNPSNPVVHYFLALAYEGAGQPKMARQHAEMAAYRNTLAITLPYFRRQALELIGRLDAGDSEAAASAG